MSRKRSISAAEYVEMESQRRTDIKPLHSTRLCTIDEGIYMIIDWYENVPEQPLTCVIQVNKDQLRNKDLRMKLPEYLVLDRDITDKEEFMTFALA